MRADSDRVAVAANEIWRKKHTLTVPEQRLLLWSIGQLKPGDFNPVTEKFKPITLTVQEYTRLTGTVSGDMHRLMQEVVIGNEGIMRRLIVVPNGKGWKAFNWLFDATYDNGVITMVLHPHLAPYVLQLKERFASVPLLPAMRLRGGYAVAFFEFCCSWRGSKNQEWTMSVPELREWLHIAPGSLEPIGHLRSRVIDQAKKELDRKAPLSFTYEALKQGRAIIGWRFTVLKNEPKSQLKSPPKNAPGKNGEQTEQQRKLAEAKAAWEQADDSVRAIWLTRISPFLRQRFEQEQGKLNPSFLAELHSVAVQGQTVLPI